eukprot:GCRY01001726.1.p1 GENE.GCRY01001726.1~~GCRY01001726.1.p1  ORF type:complete len:887 (+),score=268.23 GCRY01001726.1:142-2802(+)
MPRQRLFVLLLLFGLSVSFEASNWKKCNDSGFCKRQRGYQSSLEAYTPTFVGVEKNVIKMKLIKNSVNAEYTFEVTLLKEQIVRLRMVENNREHAQYEIPDIVDSKVIEGSVNPLVQTEDSFIFEALNMKVEISKAPFTISISYKNSVIVIINERHLLNLEHEQKRPEKTELGDDVISQQNSEAFWEETFRGTTDSKPHGPSSQGFDVTFPLASHLYGIPEHTTKHALESTEGKEPYRMYNLDVFEYELDSTAALYGGVPLMLAHGVTHTTGLFWNNAAEMMIDISPSGEANGRQTHWFAESGVVDLYIFVGPKPKDILNMYTKLTGRPQLPPLFAIAYHQCRWNYRDEEDVREVDSNFDRFNIPYDVLWLDIEHTDGKRYLTWNKDLFPNPDQMQHDLAAKGRKMVTIADPHIRKDDNYFVYKNAKSQDLFVKNKDGNVYEGHCWPGTSSYLDFTSPAVREFWADNLSLEKYGGSTDTLFIWNDMNEPSVFSGPETTMPKDNLHYGGAEHRDVHNIYGIYQHQATANGLVKRSRGQQERPFVLSRAFFAGSQRHGAIWTGDNKAEWAHLRISVPMLLSMGVAGLPFVGADVGGFFGNPDGELLARWYQAGAYQPFFRAHAHLDSKRREPWLFAEEYVDVIREAVRDRYAVLPYLYTVFYLAHTTGEPVMRPLWYTFPEKAELFDEEDTYMLGPALLVKPVTAPGQQSTILTLPGEQPWYDFKSLQSVGKGSLSVPTPQGFIPVFQRGGSVVPTQQRPRRDSAAMRHDPYTLKIALDSRATATGELYLDDFHSFAHTQGRSLLVQYALEGGVLRSTVTGDAQVRSDFANTVERVMIAGVKQNFKRCTAQTDAGKLPLEHTYDTATRVLTIRKPDLRVADDWQIHCH